MDPRATMPAPVQTSMLPVQATGTSTPPQQPAKALEGNGPYNAHPVPVAEKMTPADTRVTLPPTPEGQGSTTWPPAHCEEPSGPLGRMHSRKQAVWDEQRHLEDQQNQPKHGLLGKAADCNDPRIIIPDSPVMRPTLLERIFKRKKHEECETTVCEGTPVAPPKMEEKKAETKTMPNAAVEPPKPVDNRQSWGKYEPIEPVLPGKTTRTTQPRSRRSPIRPARRHPRQRPRSRSRTSICRTRARSRAAIR